MTDSPSATRYRIVLEYHGAEFVGWQVQSNGRSVQAVVSTALEALLGHPTHVAGAGRTDSGVHALGQVAAFNTTSTLPPDTIRDGLNAHLPRDVVCLSAEPVHPDFDPRRHATRKLYRYAWLDRRPRSPLIGDRTWHIRHRLDEHAMHEAAQHLVGTQHFDSFRSAGCAALTTERTIAAARVERRDGIVVFEIEGTGFLRHMVRILAGTLAEVGRGKRTPDSMRETLRARDREAAARTAPAHGLTKVWVRYDDRTDDQ